MEISKEKYEKQMKNYIGLFVFSVCLLIILGMLFSWIIGIIMGSSLMLETNEYLMETTLPEKVHFDNFNFVSDLNETISIQNLTVEWSKR
jgi:hypothetical protein